MRTGTAEPCRYLGDAQTFFRHTPYPFTAFPHAPGSLRIFHLGRRGSCCPGIYHSPLLLPLPVPRATHLTSHSPCCSTLFATAKPTRKPATLIHTNHSNAQRKYQGHSQHPLNEAGRQQAKRLADVLRSVPIKQFHASDLPRAEEVRPSRMTN